MRLSLLAAALLSGCATVAVPNPDDPLEGWNRNVQTFNDKVDEAVVRPVATAYRNHVPQMLRTGVTNFFGNLGDPWSALNQLLQGKLQDSVYMTMRFVANTTFGLGGIFDIATDMGLEKRSEDLGQTLGRWGVGPGPYFVLPILGPSTIRDTAALPADLAATTFSLVSDDTGVVLAASTLQLVNARANLLSASSLLDSLALDPYLFLRDAYLARRRCQVYDGNPPEERFDEPPQ